MINVLKLGFIYLVMIISTMLVGSRFGPDFLLHVKKNYIWILILNTLIFLVLIKLLKVSWKAVKIFLIFIMSALVMLIINVDFYIAFASTPDPIIFPIITFICLFITYPFQIIFMVLVGYGIGELSFVIVPIYMVCLALMSYIISRKSCMDISKHK